MLNFGLGVALAFVIIHIVNDGPECRERLFGDYLGWFVMRFLAPETPEARGEKRRPGPRSEPPGYALDRGETRRRWPCGKRRCAIGASKSSSRRATADGRSRALGRRNIVMQQARQQAILGTLTVKSGRNYPTASN